MGTRNGSGTGKSSPGDYDVGYGKPPVEHQFKPGQPPNRKGRPRRSRMSSRRLLEILMEPVKVRIGGRDCTLSFSEAYIQMTKQKALAGDVRAGRAVERWLILLDLLKPQEDALEEVRHVMTFVHVDKSTLPK